MQKNCLHCNKTFFKPYSRSVRDWNERAKYCSVACRHKEWKVGGWNKGIKYTQEQKARLNLKGLEMGRAWNKGIKLPFTVWNKGLRGVQKMAQRENSPHWKGGKQGEHQLIRHSTEYKLWREAVFKRDNYICVECSIRGGELHADHIMPFAVFPELRFAIDNGRTLCAPCHRKTATWGNGGKGKLQLQALNKQNGNY